MEVITKKEIDVKLVLVTITEDIIFRNGISGKSRTCTLQFLTPDGNYLLAERPVSEFDRELFGRFLNNPQITTQKK